jgi:HK97 family phage major capsid protein
MNPTLQELREARAGLLHQMRAIDKAAQADKRDLTDEERSKFDGLETEIKDVSRQITSHEQDQARRERLAGLESQPDGRRSQADRLMTGAVTINQVRDAAEDDPKRGFKDHRDFLMTVMSVGHGSRLDDRLKPLAASNYWSAGGRQLTAGSDEHSTFSDPYGGFLVPEAFTPRLQKVMAENDPMGSRTTKIPMSSPIVKIPARVDKNHTSSVSGGLRVYRRAESDTVASSRMEFEMVSLEAHGLYGVAYATEELLQYSAISFVALLEAGFSDEFTARLIHERLHGTGVGEYEGILNTPCLVSISKESGQAATTLVYENVVKMRSRCWGYGSAVWLANHDVLPQLVLLNQTVGTGGAILWQPSAREDHPDTLFGRPLIFTEFCKTLGTVGDLVLGNWSQYLEGTLQQMQSAESMHVRFLEHERTMKFFTYNAGRCWWRSALTTKQSSNTLSPFVVLNTRA